MITTNIYIFIHILEKNKREKKLYEQQNVRNNAITNHKTQSLQT